MIGKTISHYKILEKLGEGSMGKVYKAEDTKLKREVALKFLPKEFSRDPESKERFIGEARTASVLDHHNICTIHEIDETNNGQLFISMNYYIGETLQEKIKNEQLSIDDTLNYITQIASGLQAAHKKQIVHCDIKPGNILITEDGIVKIVDFGIAKVCCEVKLKNKNNTSGTLAYMSPEQISNAEFDDKTDIWSFGVLFYEMLTKQRPFHDSYFEALMYSIMNEEPKSIKKINPDVSQELEKIVLKMLMKNPEKRYQNITNLLADINKVQIRKPSKSVAVLPFLNTRSDPNCDYLGFALADQVIGGLIYFKNITVRASSIIRKYENQVVDPLEVGKDLKVNYIVSGNFLQEGDVIRLNVELIEMQTNEMIWRTPIEVEYKNAFKLQDIVSDKVIKGLKIQFSQDEIDRIQSDVPQNPLAYEYYLRSLSYPITNEGIKLAIEMLEKSIEIDSNYAPAYNELGRRIHQMETFGYSKPKENKRPENYYLKALSINNELMSALSNLANIYTETDRTEEAVELTKQMLEINPNNAEAHFSLGYIYRYAGMTRESIDEMEKAVALDPNNSNLRVSIGVSYFTVGDYEKASEAFEVNKESPFSLGWQGYLLFRQGNYEQADEYFDRIIAIEPDGFWALSSLLLKEIMQGNTKEGLAILYEMEQSNVDDAETWYYLASEYALLGDRDGCVRCLRRAVDGGYFPYPTILKESYFDSMRGDQEFQNILEKAKEKHLAFKKRFF